RSIPAAPRRGWIRNSGNRRDMIIAHRAPFGRKWWSHPYAIIPQLPREHNSREGRTVSGHSKWHNIRLKKGKMDAERGAKFTKLAREIIVAAKAGGGNPDANARLRIAIQKARESSMPAENIKRAVQRGTGELEGVNYDELTYE